MTHIHNTATHTTSRIIWLATTNSNTRLVTATSFRDKYVFFVSCARVIIPRFRMRCVWIALIASHALVHTVCTTNHWPFVRLARGAHSIRWLSPTAADAPSTTRPTQWTVSTPLSPNRRPPATLSRRLPHQPSLAPPLIMRPFSLKPHRPPPFWPIMRQPRTLPIMHRQPPSLATRPSCPMEQRSFITQPQRPPSTTINHNTQDTRRCCAYSENANARAADYILFWPREPVVHNYSITHSHGSKYI